MKVKNVIKGYVSREDIDRLVIINPDNDDIAIYSGDIKNYLEPNDMMKDYKKQVDNMTVLKSAINCGNQLFVIVKEEV